MLRFTQYHEKIITYYKPFIELENKMNATAQLIRPTFQPVADDLTTLVDELISAKSAEAIANNYRIKIEEKIIALCGVKEEGAQTFETSSGLKVTITGKLTYSANMAQLVALCAVLPPEFRPVKTTTTLDSTGCKYLRTNDPTTWAKIAGAITVKPAKTSVEIKA